MDGTGDADAIRRPPTGFSALADSVGRVHLLELGPAVLGGSLVIASPGKLGLAALVEAIGSADITTIWLTAGLLDLVGTGKPGLPARLREVWSGATWSRPPVVRRVLIECLGTTVVNGHGPTETTTFATRHPRACPTSVRCRT
jgi:non-ribosomal peptide synthetase component F